MSPSRKTIQTAVHLLKRHWEIKGEKGEGLTLTLDPYLIDKVEYCDSLPISRNELIAFTDKIKE